MADYKDSWHYYIKTFIAEGRTFADPILELELAYKAGFEEGVEAGYRGGTNG